MDKAGLSVAVRDFALVTMAALMSSCAIPPPVQRSTSTPAPPPMTPQPVEVQKPVNVSFSTYSREWPVDWQWIDPDESDEPTPHDVKGGVLRISIPSKKYLRGNKLSAPRYVKAIKGDFQIETRVRFAPKENYQGAGLLVYKDDGNYLRFERAYGGTGGGGEGVRLEVREGGEQMAIATPADIQTEAPEIDLRIVRNGGLFVAFWRESEEHPWREAGEYQSQYPESILVGVVGVNTARPVTAEFAYIKLLPGTGQ